MQVLCDGDADFFADGFGRWPALIAAEFAVDDELGDYIAEEETLYMKKSGVRWGGLTHSIFTPESGHKCPGRGMSAFDS